MIVPVGKKVTAINDSTTIRPITDKTVGTQLADLGLPTQITATIDGTEGQIIAGVI
ncbi:MAG: hypothetical protein ACOYIB_02485 [Desulfosporosinus sp.]